jgi:DNA-binding transcriptional MocR family regulator
VVDSWAQGLAPLVQYLPGQAGAFCCLRLNPETFGAAEIEQFHQALSGRRTVVARGEWFGDSPNIIRVGPSFEPASKLPAALDAVSAALQESARPAYQGAP